jgi:hypothetical protein
MDKPQARKGRGATENPANRFHEQTIEFVDDGWDQAEELTPLKTELFRDASKSGFPGLPEFNTEGFAPPPQNTAQLQLF